MDVICRAVPKLLRKTKLMEVKGRRVFGVPLLVSLQQTGEPLPPSILRALIHLRAKCLDQVRLDSCQIKRVGGKLSECPLPVRWVFSGSRGWSLVYSTCATWWSQTLVVFPTRVTLLSTSPTWWNSISETCRSPFSQVNCVRPSSTSTSVSKRLFISEDHFLISVWNHTTSEPFPASSQQIFPKISSCWRLRQPSCCSLMRTGRRCGRCCSSCETWWPVWTKTKWHPPTSLFVWRPRCSTWTPWRRMPNHPGNLSGPHKHNCL